MKYLLADILSAFFIGLGVGQILFGSILIMLFLSFAGAASALYIGMDGYFKRKDNKRYLR